MCAGADDDPPSLPVLSAWQKAVVSKPRVGSAPIGPRPLETVSGWTEDQEVASVILPTFADVPPNRPHYERLGFGAVGVAEQSAGLRRIRATGSAGTGGRARSAPAPPPPAAPATTFRGSDNDGPAERNTAATRRGLARGSMRRSAWRAGFPDHTFTARKPESRGGAARLRRVSGRSADTAPEPDTRRPASAIAAPRASFRRPRPPRRPPARAMPCRLRPGRPRLARRRPRAPLLHWPRGRCPR